MRKKALVLSAVLALSAMTFVGCGNQDNNNSTTDQESTAPDTTDDTGIGNDSAASPAGNDNGGAMDDLEDGAEDAIDGAGDAVDDAVDDLDGSDDAGNGTDDATQNDTTAKDSKKKK